MKANKLKAMVSALLVGSAVLYLSSTAEAALMTVGGPQEGNSWSQGFSYSGLEATSLEAFITVDGGGGPFEAPGVSISLAIDNALNDVTAGWAGGLVNPLYALATGTAASFINFDLLFLGDPDFPDGVAAPLSLDLLLWSGAPLAVGSDVVVSGKFTWVDGAFNFTPTAADDPTGFGYARDTTSVPDGGTTLILLGLATMGMSALRRKLA